MDAIYVGQTVFSKMKRNRSLIGSRASVDSIQKDAGPKSMASKTKVHQPLRDQEWLGLIQS
jgi:hypothetical protein